MRLTSDIDANQIRKILEVLREETKIFEGMSLDEVVDLQ
jgi:hypothetical protein